MAATRLPFYPSLLAAMHLTLLVPELIWSNPDDGEVFATLDAQAPAPRLAGRPPARRAEAATELALAELAGFESPAPLAALRLAGEQGAASANAYWLCADPVHLRFHQELLILADNSEVQLADAESAALIDSLNRELAPARFHRAATDRWYVSLPEAAGAGNAPVSAVAGRSLSITQLAAAPAVRRLANEAQMILHHHPVNARRQEAGRPTANALWLWGGGALPDTPPDTAHSAFVGDNPLLAGLAAALRRPAKTPPESYPGLTGTGDHPLLLLDTLQRPAQHQDATAYLAAWQQLAKCWLTPAFGALRRGRLRQLRLVAPTAYGVLDWQLTPLDLWRPHWRRPRLSALAADLARTPRS